MEDSLMTPQQLKAITEKLVEFYAIDYRAKKLDHPHHEHIDVDGHRYKVGYLPDSGSASTIMNIRIVSKENKNGN